MVAQKTRAALDAKLNVILCIGETLEQRESGDTKVVCEEQLKAVVGVLKESDWRYDNMLAFVVCGPFMDSSPSNVVIAYEPVWAIGTGKVATSAQAQETHVDIRAYLSRAVSPAIASSTRIIYGGSVNSANCKELGEYPAYSLAW
jgi:triosephosphate isomerase